MYFSAEPISKIGPTTICIKLKEGPIRMYFSAEPIGFSCKEPDFCEDNPNPYIVVIISGLVAITYIIHLM